MYVEQKSVIESISHGYFEKVCTKRDASDVTIALPANVQHI